MNLPWVAGTLIRANACKDLAKKALGADTITSIVMAPFGFLSHFVDSRIGHDGKRRIELFFTNPPVMAFRLWMLGEHFAIGWLSAAPLLILFVLVKNRFPVRSKNIRSTWPVRSRAARLPE